MARTGKVVKSERGRKGPTPARSAGSLSRCLSPEAQELRLLMQRVPDGLKATLAALEARTPEARERVLQELARSLGKEALPLFRAACLGAGEAVAVSAIRVLPLFGTRAAGDLLAETHDTFLNTERAAAAGASARALRARGISVAIPEPVETGSRLTLQLRETWVSSPDPFGTRSVVARLQDPYGVWYAILVTWDDRIDPADSAVPTASGKLEGALLTMSRQEWEERQQRLERRGLCLAPCPADYVRYLVAEMRARCSSAGPETEEALTAWTQFVGLPPEDYVLPALPVTDLDTEPAQTWLRGSDQLFRQPDIARWRLRPHVCARWVRSWADLRNRLRFRGGVEADHADLGDEKLQLLRDACAELFDDTVREQYRVRMRDASQVYAWRQAETAAGQAAAVALALERGVAPADIPFFVTLVDRSLEAAHAQSTLGLEVERYRQRSPRK